MIQDKHNADSCETNSAAFWSSFPSPINNTLLVHFISLHCTELHLLALYWASLHYTAPNWPLYCTSLYTLYHTAQKLDNFVAKKDNLLRDLIVEKSWGQTEAICSLFLCECVFVWWLGQISPSGHRQPSLDQDQESSGPGICLGFTFFFPIRKMDLFYSRSRCSSAGNARRLVNP